MAQTWIDLRSDTVTRPTPGMRAAMAAAEVGDDVFSDDPTVNHLQERVAALLGKEAGLFVPAGTMSNQIALRIHTQPGDEILLDPTCHIYQYEAGAPAVLSGLTCRTIDADCGILDVSQLSDKIRGDNEHLVRTRLVCLENTHNCGGGKVYPLEKIEAISQWARSNGLAMHLDGARLWNAVVASGIKANVWAAHFDTVSVCFSKGLGAPVGSMLVGPRELIKKGRRVRKMFGGGMRQVGILAAAALYALDHHVERLAEDHRHAQIIAAAIRNHPGLYLVPEEVETNLIWFGTKRDWPNAKEVQAALKEQGILVHISGPQLLRACTHLDVSKEQVERAAKVIRQLTGRLAPVG